MKRYYLLILGLVLIIPINAQEFVQWRGDNRDGIYNEKGLLDVWPTDGPKLLWHFDDLGVGHASAAVTKDKVYTAGTHDNTGSIFAFNNSGDLLWKSEYGKEWITNYPGIRSTPVIDKNKLYIMSGYNKVSCMNADNGELIWAVDLMSEYDGRNIRWGICENLVISGNKLFCTPGGKETNVIALDKNSGKLIWKGKGNGQESAYNSPMVIKHNGREIFVTITASSILGIDASNGNLLWSYEHTNTYSVHANTPIYYNGQLYCFSGYGKGGVMLKISDDGNSISKVWSNDLLDSRMGGAVLVDGKLYGSGDKNKRWMCIDWKTGKELYSSTWMSKGNIIYADSKFYWYSERGEVGLVKAGSDNFNEISKFKVPYGSQQHWAHLVIHNKKLYVRHGNSLMVYAI